MAGTNYVVLWFDTEDYLLPASNDAAKRIAETFTREGVRATFKMVGERARVVEQRERTDVIAALARQEIGRPPDSARVLPAELTGAQCVAENSP